jgi:GNAT superfamily N-acetyltransferase
MGYILREAHLADVTFMVDLIETDGAAGHYKLPSAPEQTRAAEVFKFQSAIIDGRIAYSFAPEMKARVFILEADSERAGFALEREPPFETFERRGAALIELHMLSVAPEFRGRGCGSHLLDLLIGRHPESQPLFGRCFETSVDMMRMLRRRKFREVMRHEGTHHFLRAGSLTARMFAKELRTMLGP